MEPTTSEDSESTETQNVLSQHEYEPTPYQDATWEVVGERKNLETFEPLEMTVIPIEGRVVDPMFEDYGGIGPADSFTRWHLPEHLAYKNPNEQRLRDEEALQEEGKVSLTEEEITRIKAEAFEEGRKVALEQATKEAQTHRSALEEQVTTLMNDLVCQFKEQIHQIENEALQFSLEVARKIIGSAVEINPEYILKIIQEAISKSGTASIKKIRISPQDLEFVQMIKLIEKLKDYDGSWNFEGDETIKSGCVIETSSGDIDFQLDRAFDRLAEEAIKFSKSV